MVAAPVDPRDVRWETDVRSYRVCFWSPAGDHCHEHELSDLPDVAAVLAWADEHAEGRVTEVVAHLVCDGEPGVARLPGRCPDSAGTPSSGRDARLLPGTS